MRPSDLRKRWISLRLRLLGPWFHNIEISNGLSTFASGGEDYRMQYMPIREDYPLYLFQRFEPYILDCLRKNVLDIGCNQGYFSIEMAKRGANVVSLDRMRRFLKGLTYVAKLMGLSGRIRPLRVDIEKDRWWTKIPARDFEVVLCTGVLYHLNDPMKFIRSLKNLNIRRFIGETRILKEDVFGNRRAFEDDRPGVLYTAAEFEQMIMENPRAVRFQGLRYVLEEDEIRMTCYYRMWQDRMIFVVDYK